MYEYFPSTQNESMGYACILYRNVNFKCVGVSDSEKVDPLADFKITKIGDFIVDDCNYNSSAIFVVEKNLALIKIL